MGNTVLLATVCAAKAAVPGTDFMPLQVDYREQYRDVYKRQLIRRLFYIIVVIQRVVEPLRSLLIITMM